MRLLADRSPRYVLSATALMASAIRAEPRDRGRA